MVTRCIASALLLISASAAVYADRGEQGAGGALNMSLRGGAENDAASSEERIHAATAAVEIRAIYGVRFALAADFGFEVGAEVPGGFGYALRLAPLGGAVRFGGRGWLGATIGLGGSGVIDRVPIGLEIPVTTFVAFDLGKWIRFSSRLRGAWVPTSDSRADGSMTTSAVDEIDFEAGIAIGKRKYQFRSVFSDGTYVGVFVREQMGHRVLGVSIALAISGAGRF